MTAINWTVKAMKQMGKLPAQQRKAISVAVGVELVDLSQARNVIRLTNDAYGYRLRVGVYRVFFEFDGAIRIVTIEEVKKRDEQTY